MKPERVAWVSALVVCAALLAAPWRGHVDDFDAQMYTVVARNMARDHSWFDLRCLPSLHPVFREHLPFGFWPAAAAIRAGLERAIDPLYALMTLGGIATLVKGPFGLLPLACVAAVRIRDWRAAATVLAALVPLGVFLAVEPAG